MTTEIYLIFPDWDPPPVEVHMDPIPRTGEHLTYEEGIFGWCKCSTVSGAKRRSRWTSNTWVPRPRGWDCLTHSLIHDMLV